MHLAGVAGARISTTGSDGSVNFAPRDAILAEPAGEYLGSDGLAVPAAGEQRAGIPDGLPVVGPGRGGVALRR
jgi:hypothetical protein